MMDDKKGTYMGERAITDQLLAESEGRPAIDPEMLAKLQQMVAAEKESNHIREMANIGADMAEGGTKSSRLSLDDTAKSKLQGMLAKNQGISDKDRLSIQKGREQMAGYGDLNENKQESINTRFDKRLDFNKEKFTWKQGEEGEKKLTDELTSFRNTIKPITARLDAARAAKTLLASDNPIADKAILRTMARMSGEVGAMTQKDVDDFGGAQDILSRMEQAFNTAVNGKLTPENKAWLMRLTLAFEKTNLDSKNERAIEYAGQRGFGSLDSQKLYDTFMVTDKWKPSQAKSKDKPESKPEVGLKEETPVQPVEAPASNGVKVEGGFEVWSDADYDYRREEGSTLIQKKKKRK